MLKFGLNIQGWPDSVWELRNEAVAWTRHNERISNVNKVSDAVARRQKKASPGPDSFLRKIEGEATTI